MKARTIVTAFLFLSITAVAALIAMIPTDAAYAAPDVSNTIDGAYALFKNPPAGYRSVTFWVWNNRISEKEIDEQWWIAINPHDEKLKCSHGPVVEPFTMYVEFNGWPAGIVTMNGGMFAAGSAANEDAFIDALKRAAEV